MVIADIILLSVVAWAAGMVTYLVVRNDRNTQQTLDALLVLTDKQAAVAAAGIHRARGQKVAEMQKKSEREISRMRTDEMLDDISRTGLMTDDQERYLKDQNAL